MPESFNLDRLPTPIGTALLVTDADGLLRALDWEDYEPRMERLLRLHYGAVNLKIARAPRELRAALTGYFKGDLDRLAAIEWHAVPAKGLERAARDSSRHDAELWRARREAADAQSRPRRRPRQWCQSDQRRPALSPPDRRQRVAGEVWRRAGAQALAVAARGRSDSKKGDGSIKRLGGVLEDPSQV